MNKELVQMAFSRYRLKKCMTLQQSIEFLWQHNLINVGELAERAIASAGNVKQNDRNQEGSDFSDLSDSKYTTAQYYQTAYYATVTGFQNKVGTLRVCCYEPKTGKNYYFLIPHRVYRKYQKEGKQESLKIWFNRDGSPRRPRSRKRPDLWNYEVTKQEWASKTRK